MKKLSVLVTAAVLAAIMVFGSSAQVLAAKPDRIDFGIVGITAGQTARLNVVNVGRKVDKGCQVELIFLDSVDNILDTFTVNVQPDKSVFNDMEGNRFVSQEPDRIQIRAIVLRNLNKRNRCRVIPTLEVFDNDTGKTIIAIGQPNITRDPGLIDDIDDDDDDDDDDN